MPVADRRLTRSNFFPSGFRAVISKISSKRVTRAEVAVAIFDVVVYCKYVSPVMVHVLINFL